MPKSQDSLRSSEPLLTISLPSQGLVEGSAEAAAASLGWHAPWPTGSACSWWLWPWECRGGRRQLPPRVCHVAPLQRLQLPGLVPLLGPLKVTRVWGQPTGLWLPGSPSDASPGPGPAGALYFSLVAKRLPR